MVGNTAGDVDDFYPRKPGHPAPVPHRAASSLGGDRSDAQGSHSSSSSSRRDGVQRSMITLDLA